MGQSPSAILKKTDVCVYGGTAAGVIAAYTAKMRGKKVLLVEPGRHLGGMTSGGLGYTDIGNKYVITGLARDFYRRVGAHYGKFEQWIFEPHVAEDILRDYIKRANIEVLYNCRILDATKDAGGLIRKIGLAGPDKPTHRTDLTVQAAIFIDCSYEGDLMAAAGVSYTVGREDNNLYKETYNGVQLLDKHQFPDGIDPYRTPGNPASGLLWGISSQGPAPAGSGDKKVQAYNYRICLSNDPANRITITRPDNYDASHYELLLRIMEKKPWKDLAAGLKFDLMPNHKTDINNNGAMSTDMIGMNYNYPEADEATRRAITRSHEEYNKGLLYFLGNDPRVPEHLRKAMLDWGYPKDEYTDNGNWSFQLYVREARRMKGEYIMTQANCQGRAVVADGIGMAAYTMDSHNCQRVVVNGMVKNEGDVQIGGFAPYPVSYRAIIPATGQATNLFVPVCLSASHIAYGSIRMEPVFMVLAQAAATAACVAIDEKLPVQQVPVNKVRQILAEDPLADGSQGEILTDDADETCTLVTGNWQKMHNGGYGPGFLAATPPVAGSAVAHSLRFTPTITRSGLYHVYSYVPMLPSASTVITITVFDGKKAIEKRLDLTGLRVEGQTSGEWVHVGDFRLDAGHQAYAEISDRGANGTVPADAILWVAEKK